MYKWTYTGDAEIPSSARIIFSNAGNSQSPGNNEGGYKFVNGGVYKLGSGLEPYDIIEASGLSVKLSPNGGTFVGTQDVTITATNATSAWYKIGNGAQMSFNGTATFTLGTDMVDGESVTVSWSATDGIETKTGSAVYTKVDTKSTVWHIYFDNSAANWSNVYCYIYGSNECNEITGGWPGTKLAKNGDYYEYTVETEGALDACNVIFNNGSGIQTGDNVKVRNYGIYNANGDTGLSGVENVATDDPNAPEEYYNLQGMRVEYPTSAGVYLVKKGNKVSKRIIR